MKKKQRAGSDASIEMSDTVYFKQEYDLYFQSQSSLDKTERESVCGVFGVRFKSCELPLVEEKQHCNITWIFFFLQVFNQTTRWHFLTVLLSSMFFWIRRKPQRLKTKVAITSVWPLGSLFYCYYSFHEVVCVITNYPGDSIDCQLELSLQYLYSGKRFLFVC